MTEPVTVICEGACTVTHVITINVPPFNLTEEQGGQIGAAILLVWALAWGFRELIRLVRTQSGGHSTTEDET